MRWVVLAVALTLAGCEKASTKAIEEAKMVEQTGDHAATCTAKKKIADAFLAERDQANYATYAASARSYCMLDQMLRENGMR